MRTTIALLVAFLGLPAAGAQAPVLAALEELKAGTDGERFAGWFAARERVRAALVARIARVVEKIRSGLLGTSVIDRDLRAFLETEDAADLLYSELVAPRLRRTAVHRALPGVIARADDGGVQIPRSVRASATELLERLEQTEPVADDLEAWLLRIVGRHYAHRLRGDDPLTESWRKVLSTDAVLRLAATANAPQGNADVAKVLLDHTAFGRALVRYPDGAWRINRHAYRAVDEVLQQLQRRAQERAPRLAAAGGNHTLVRAAELSVPAPEPAPAEVHDGPRTVVDLAALEYDSDHLELLRSSAFYNPRTGYGARLWYTEFDDHHTARLFGHFSWTAQTSKNLEDFLTRVRDRARRMAHMGRTHDKIIVVVENVPAWLSSSQDRGTFEGGARPNACAHPPRDPKTWATMVRETAKALSKIEGVERYYEFWNEPDGQFWQAGLEEFLELYAVTAQAVREGDPDGKVGGCAPNQWDRPLKKAPGTDAVNLELIRYCQERNVPLDFVSWHHFGRPVAAIAEAKSAFEAELRRAGATEMPEFLVTEWSTPARGTSQAPSWLVEMMLGFFAAQVDAQTIACWEEFHRKPDPKHYAPWGIVTQQGSKKGTYYAHRFVDRLSRGCTGLAVVREENGPTIVVARKDDGVHDLLAWRTGYSKRFRAALDALKGHGVTGNDLRVFRSADRLERAIANGEVIGGLSEAAVRDACAAYRQHGAPRFALEIAGADSLEVLTAESVRMNHEPRKPVSVQGRVVHCELEPYEVLRLAVRVR